MVAETCANTWLARDKGRDTDAFCSFIKEHGMRTIIPAIKPRKAHSAHERRSDALPHVMTNSRTIFSLRRALSTCSLIGFELVASAPQKRQSA